jgi:hypothetical protein
MENGTGKMELVLKVAESVTLLAVLFGGEYTQLV